MRWRGFTLVELIIVIAIISVIAAVVFVAVDPAKRLHAARNSTRWTDVTALFGAIKQYQADNGGSLPATATAIDSTTASVQIIGENTAGVACGAVTCTGQTVVGTACFANALDTDLAAFLKKIPKDPNNGTTDDTRYYINKDANSLIIIGACDPEGEGAGGGGTAPTIEVSG